MSLHLQRQIDALKEMILALGDQTEEAVEKAIQAVQQGDASLAQQVIDQDEQIDLKEVQIEEECLHTLALHQPVAFDLRYVIAVLKINNDLERIADLAVNIAEQAIFLTQEVRLKHLPFDLHGMTQRVRKMLSESLQAMVNSDVELAEQVRRQDDEVDAIHRDMYRQITSAMAENADQIDQLMHLVGVSRNLERIADHAENIAEDVVYSARGDILRHSRPHPLLEKRERSD